MSKIWNVLIGHLKFLYSIRKIEHARQPIRSDVMLKLCYKYCTYGNKKHELKYPTSDIGKGLILSCHGVTKE